MKRLLMATVGASALLASASYAADLPRQPAPAKVAPPAPWSWTGFGIGGAAGYDWGTDKSSVTFGKTTLTGNDKPAGFAYGGFIYAQKQFANGLVPGVQVTWYGLNDKAHTLVTGLPPLATPITKTDKFADLWLAEGKLGFANVASMVNLSSAWLPYVSGGLACGKSKTTFSGGANAVSNKDDNCGWTIGAGIDWAPYTSQFGVVVVGLKYNYVDLGTVHTSFPIGGGAGFDIPNKQKENIFMLTLSLLN